VSHVLDLFVFVDALGWEICEWAEAFPGLDVTRRPLETQFGYSSACLPTILSGASASEHGHWNMFYRPAERPTFRRLRWLRHLPGDLRVPNRLAGPVNRLIKRSAGLSGYFALHQLPLQRLAEFDVCEREDIFAPDAFPQTGSILADVRDAQLAAHVSDWRAPEAARWDALSAALAGPRRLDWAFLYLAELDGLLHRHGWPHASPRARIAADARRLQALVRRAEGLGYEVRLALFSDHGMANCRQTVDLRRQLAPLPCREGRDYVAFLDSTMARYWSEDERVLASLRAELERTPGVLVLEPQTLEAWGAYFPGGEYGDLIALVEPGTLLVPSDMGRRAIAGMHGYAPDHPDSWAALLSNYEVEPEVTRLADLRQLMSAPLRACAAA